MNNSAGSYRFDRLQDWQKEKELDRLKQQANITLSQEQKIWQEIGLTSNLKILDLGCGSGIISSELAKITYPGEVIGIDLSESMLKQACWLKDSQGITNLNFQLGDAYQLKFPDNYFDFVYSRLLFQHLIEPVKVLKNIYRILKPGGMLYILDVDDRWFTLYPEPKSFASLYQKLTSLQKSQGGDPYIGRKLGSYVHQAGFNQVQTQIEVITSDRFGLNNLLNLLSFGNTHQSPEISQAQQNIYSLLDLPYAWIGMGIFIVTGCKPMC